MLEIGAVGVGSGAPPVRDREPRLRGRRAQVPPPHSQPGPAEATRATSFPEPFHLSETPDAGTAGLEAALQRATGLAEEGDWAAAFGTLLEAEPSHPRDPTLLCMLGVAAGEVDAGGLAYDFFRRALAEQPEDPNLLVALGQGLARYDDPDAEGVLRLAALTAPDLPGTRLAYGALLVREGMLEQGIGELQAAREVEEGSGEVARELAGAYLLAGRVEEGLDELERAAGLAEDDPEVQLLLAVALISHGRLEEGAEAAYRAATADVESGDAQLVSALACATQEWWDQAWDALAQASAAEIPPDPLLLEEVEEALDTGEEAAERVLLDQVAPSLLRERLVRPR